MPGKIWNRPARHAMLCLRGPLPHRIISPSTPPDRSMRLFAAVATAAVLCLPAPAAAQPDARQIMHGAVEQLRRNVPAEVRDYTLTIRSGPLRSELYVYRSEDGWTTEIPYDGGVADLFLEMAIWPALSTAGQDLADVRYLGADSLEGRAVHVLDAPVPGLEVAGIEMSGSARVHVDAETRQVLRVATSTELEPGEGLLAEGGHAEVALTFGGYETADGVTLPRRMHMHFRLQLNVPEAQRAEARREIEAMLAGSGADTSDEATEGRTMLEIMLRMLNGEPVDVPAVVEEVRVNAGPPGWSEMSP